MSTAQVLISTQLGQLSASLTTLTATSNGPVVVTKTLEVTPIAPFTYTTPVQTITPSAGGGAPLTTIWATLTAVPSSTSSAVVGSATSVPSSAKASHDRLSEAAEIGTIIGCILGALAIAVAVFFGRREWKKRHEGNMSITTQQPNHFTVNVSGDVYAAVPAPGPPRFFGRAVGSPSGGAARITE